MSLWRKRVYFMNLHKDKSVNCKGGHYEKAIDNLYLYFFPSYAYIL